MRNMTRKAISLSLLLTFLLLLPACSEEEQEAETVLTPVEVMKVEKGAISAESSVSGEVASGTQESVFVAVSARCTNVYVEAGDYVAAGQTICTLDMSATWASYETATMNLANAQKSYEEQSALLQQQVDMAEKNVADTEALLAAGAASQLELDNAKLQLESAKTSMSSALSQLELSIQSAQSNITQLEASLANISRNGSVTAPISGNIQELNAAKNTFVSPSMPVVTVDSTSDMEITASVAESLVSKLAVGGRADVTVSSADTSFTGTITAIDHSPNAQTHLYTVTISIPSGKAGGLLSGMFADIIFYTDAQYNTIVIPSEAIQTGTDGQYVYTVDSNDTVHRITVETGLVGNGVTEITTGLVGGETLVCVGQFYLSDGETVRIVSREV